MSLLLAVNTGLNVLFSGSLRLFFFFFLVWLNLCITFQDLWTTASVTHALPTLTLKSGSGRPRSWCACWSAAQTLSPGDDGTKSGREFTLGRLTAAAQQQADQSAGRPPAATHLHCHSEVVPVFNFRDLQLQPHGHLQHKRTSKIDLIWGRKTEINWQKIYSI